eukprot:763480-Hanusia_phi.AAC.3
MTPARGPCRSPSSLLPVPHRMLAAAGRIRLHERHERPAVAHDAAAQRQHPIPALARHKILRLSARQSPGNQLGTVTRFPRARELVKAATCSSTCAPRGRLDTCQTAGVELERRGRRRSYLNEAGEGAGEVGGERLVENLLRAAGAGDVNQEDRVLEDLPVGRVAL